MASILIDWGTKIVAKLGELALGEARYLICFKCIAEEFEKEKKKLIARKTSVEEDVVDARSRTENVRSEVDTWLKKANKYIEEEPRAKSHEEDTKKKMSFLLRRCPKCFRLYLRGKELDEMKLEILELRQTKFEKVGRAAKGPGVEFYAPQNFIELTSRTLAYKKVLEALIDGDNYIVGLHGLGGTGKTTLATKVGLELKQQKVFDEVVFTTVSNDPNITNIQDEIASPLGLSFKDEKEINRPKKLWSRLTNGDKILIILDDVCKKLDFNAIGIPLSSNGHYCKVLLTSRVAKVCNVMQCESPIMLQPLSEGEAQILFKSIAGISNKSPKDVKDKGKEIARECKGLPIAIATIASTLKGQPLKDWKAALIALKSVDDTDEFIEIYERLKVSYDYLNDDFAKKLLLLCSLFPEDYEIPMEDFIKFGIGLGLFGDVHLYEDIRSHVDKASKKLIDSCLLLEGQEGHVKMHDLVRDATHWIATKENQFGILHMIPGKNVTKKQCSMEVRYLYCRGIFINDQLDWTKLEILILADIDNNFVKLQEAFYGRMKNLRVLALDNKGPWWRRINLPLVQSFELLKHLQTLRLTNFKLDNITIVGNLQTLEIFELSDCDVDELSIGIAKLRNLRLLSITRCNFKHDPYKVIGQFSSLQELYVKNIYRIDYRENWDFNKEVISDLFQKDGISTKLQRYHLEVRNGSKSYHWRIDHSISRALAIQYFDPDATNAPIMDLVCRAECLNLIQVQGEYKAMIPDILEAIKGEMKELTSFTLYSCSKIEYLVNATNTHSLSMAKNVFSNLVELFLYNMDALLALCYSWSPQELSFDRLKRVHFKCCPMLTYVFTLSIACSLVALEELLICECKELKYIITNEQLGEEEEVEDGHVQMFQKLKTLKIIDCDHIKFIFPVFSARDLKQLETTKISSCGELKYIFGHWEPENHNSHQHIKEIILPLLQKMELEEVPKFIDIFPKCCHLNPSSLSTDESTLRNDLVAEQQDPHKHYTFPWVPMCCFYGLKSRRSSVNQDNINVSKELQASNSRCVCPSDATQYFMGKLWNLRNIKEIKLANCGEITSLFSLSIASKMVLEKLKIEKCHGMKCVITYVENILNRIVFPKLKHFSVEKCRSLEYIVSYKHDKEQNHNIELDIEFPALEALNLKHLEKIIGICPQSCNVTCPSLEEFCLDDCFKFTTTTISDSIVGFDRRQMDCTSTKTSKLECLPLVDTTEMSSSEGLLLVTTSHCLLPQSMMLQHVKRVVLNNCGRIKSLFTLSTASMMLWKELKIEKCNELKYIIIDMGNNHAHISIFPKLKKLQVNDCSKLEYVVGLYHHEGSNDDIDIHIDFPVLEGLFLQNLPNMISICHINYYAICPSLNTLSMDNGSEFSVKSFSAFMVGWDEKNLDGAPAKDLERIVKHLETMPILLLAKMNIEGIFCVEESSIKDVQTVTSRTTNLGLKQLCGLKYIWNIGAKHFLHLKHMTELVIVGCGELEVIFSVCIVRNLPHLKGLMIINCKKLEKIVEEDEENAVSPQVCFPELKGILVKDCDQLKHVLSMSTPNEFPKLEFLIIQEASQLNQAFRAKLEGKGEIEEPKQVVLPKLECVILIKLPMLRDVCEGMDLERVKYKFVRDCNSNITSTSETAVLRRYRAKYFNYRDNLDLGADMYDMTRRLINRIAAETTIAPSQVGTENLNFMKLEAATESEQSSSMEQKDEHLVCEPSLKDQQQAHGQTENTVKIPQEINKEQMAKDLSELSSKDQQEIIEKIKEQSLEEYSRSKEIDHMEELVDKQLMSEPCSKDQRQALGNTKNAPNNLEATNNNKEMEEQNLEIGPELKEELAVENESTLPETKTAQLITHTNMSSQTVKEAEEHIHQKFYCPKSEESAVEENLLMKTDGDATSRASPSLQEDFINEQFLSQPSSKDQQRTEKVEGQNLQDCLGLEEAVAENGSRKTEVVTSTLSGKERAQPSPSTILVNKASQTKEAYTEINSKVDPRYLQDFTNESLIQSMEEDGTAHEPTPSFSMIAEMHVAKDNLVTKVLGDLEVYLKMHLKYIVSSESKSMCLQTSLHFLSRLSMGDGLLSPELKSVVDSLQHEFPGILCSFKEASTVVKKFIDVEEREKFIKDKLTLQREISKLKDEAQEKKAILENQIYRLQVELEFENVKKDKSQLLDTERKARQELLKADYKWSIFCCQFERSLGARNASTSVSHMHETSNLKDKIRVNPSHLQESEIYHTSSLFHNVEEDVVPVCLPTLPVIANGNFVNEENLVSKVLADSEVFMKMPLKDIATSEDNSLCLYTALNFLSHLSCEDEALSNVLKSVINDLYQDFPSILRSFKEAFAMIKKISELEEREEPIQEKLPRQKEKVISLGSVYHNMDEAIHKEATLKEQITRLQVELERVKETVKDCEASLPSLQEQKNKCDADIKGLEMEFEGVKKDKCQLVEDQRKAKQVLIHIDYKWRLLCSRFEMNRIAARNVF